MARPTCWVLDHPAHLQILTGFIRGGSTSDLIIACDRPEVRAMIDASEGVLPRRQMLWVPRPVGQLKEVKAGRRLLASTRFLKQSVVERVIGIGTGVEMWAARRARIPQRIYISDTEVNHLAHRLARRNASHAILPTHWREDLDGGFLRRFKGVIHRFEGLHGHIHLQPGLRPQQVSDPPRVLVRRLLGDGIHDTDEVVGIPNEILEGLDIEYADEEGVESTWSLPSSIGGFDGVITQSVTLASEAVIQGVPTLLVSNAQRGFLDELEKMGLPLHRIGEEDMEQVHREWLAGLHLTDVIENRQWPDILEGWKRIIGEHVPL